jgi:hypothetical protein
MLEFWNNGIMGAGVMGWWFKDKIHIDDRIKNG